MYRGTSDFNTRKREATIDGLVQAMLCGKKVMVVCETEQYAKELIAEARRKYELLTRS